MQLFVMYKSLEKNKENDFSWNRFAFLFFLSQNNFETTKWFIEIKSKYILNLQTNVISQSVKCVCNWARFVSYKIVHNVI